ncbi:MATE family efflux transporter [Achromobacter aloeverae]|uniref:MATE family efflux transporter n=1 Tax=Achromobacter aloeverae TaxID=1750518 RepID=A0A4Q1HMT5_9BURK|nr:MATE family efflux transporter [Achromobacter aloeverae]RXN91252.1 MATE family efflux transporter [Achromobacter aloeverae]
MLEAPIASTLLRMGWPNLLMMLAQSSTGLVEMWFLAKLGTDALAGVAVVIPILMLMQNMSQGAMGGGISSAISRALGAGDGALADSQARHAVVLNALVGIAFTAIFLALGGALFQRLGATGAALEYARTYGRVLFAGLPFMWTMNALASVIRGTGNMLVPGAVICGGAFLLIPAAGALIFGIGPLPALGVAGGAWALVAYYAVGTLVLGWYCVSGRNLARLQRGPLHWAPMRGILAVGGIACLNPVLTNSLIAISTAIVSAYAGTQALAGYATAARLEYLLMPIGFGLGAPMVALVGANLGAGQAERARRIALTGGAMAFALAEIVGVLAAIWPHAWLRLFGTDALMLETGAHYLRIVGPFFGFFGLGFSLYFASQGARRLKWPLLAGALRLALYAGAGGIALSITGSLTTLFAAGAIAMVVYGACIFASVRHGQWAPASRGA